MPKHASSQIRSVFCQNTCTPRNGGSIMGDVCFELRIFPLICAAIAANAFVVMQNRGTVIAGLAGLFWLVLVAVSPGGLWVPDETVLFAATETFWREGTLVIDNGFEQFGHSAMLFNDLLKPGPHGAVPQYPSGYTVAMVPVYALAGIKGIMAVNAIAGALSVWMTHRLAVLLTADHRTAHVSALLLAVCSFLVIYAKAVWPHAIATAFVLTTCFFFLRAVGCAGYWRRDAVLAGLVLGLGLLVRVDVVLIAPALLATGLVMAARPWALIALAGSGVLPGALMASGFNWLKFGHFFPVSYGTTGGGGTALGSYLWLLAGVGLVLVLCLGLRATPTAGRRITFWALPFIGLMLGALLLIPALDPLKQGLYRLGTGTYTLWIDLRVKGGGGQATLHPDGTLTVFGLYKKAVAQSLPWMAIIGVLLVRKPQPETRAGLIFCALAIAVWTPLFARTSWHGGFATNMRYFLPVVPFVCILAASAWCALPSLTRRATILCWMAGIALTFAAIAATVAFHPQPAIATLQHNLPLAVFVLLLALALFSPLGAKLQIFTRVVFAGAITLGLITTYFFDLAVDVGRRDWSARAAERVAELPQNAFVYTRIYEPMLAQIRRGTPIAARNRFTDELDPKLLDRAFESDFEVFVESDVLRDQALAARPALRATAMFPDAPWMSPIYRLEPLP